MEVETYCKINTKGLEVLSMSSCVCFQCFNVDIIYFWGMMKLTALIFEYFVTRNYSIIIKTQSKSCAGKLEDTKQTDICSFYPLLNMEKLFEHLVNTVR